jgi:tRNA nucleotidyltransferase (CCA-adding enzyme)
LNEQPQTEAPQIDQPQRVAQPADGRAVIERVRALPGGAPLLELAVGRDDVELVGGAVRDMLLGRTPRELDVVVAGDAETFARKLATRLADLTGENPDEQMESSFHERFRTALVSWPGGHVDVAARRSESYAAPGALPDVRAGTPDEDLRRRDFTVNAIAIALGGARRGELRAAPDALEDLANGRLRVLHERSFIDDPTRLLRLARYATRLGFGPDERTARLAAEAIAEGALSTVSHARIGAELRLTLAEPDPVGALESLQQLGVLSALHEAIELDVPLARAALAALPPAADAWPDVLLLASLLLPARRYDTTDYEARLRALLDSFEFPAAERERAVHSAILAPRLAERLKRAHSASQVYETAHHAPLEAVALAAALAEAEGDPDAPARARSWLSELCHVRLTITGDDLLAAGIAAGPEIGRRLEQALRRKLDGELEAGREAELRAALEGS